MVDVLIKAGADPRKGKRGPPGADEGDGDDGSGEQRKAVTVDPEDKKKGSCCCGGSGKSSKKEDKGDDVTGFLDKGSAV
jgi:hypothetical protein